jgi:hypothetical protein
MEPSASGPTISIRLKGGRQSEHADDALHPAASRDD